MSSTGGKVKKKKKKVNPVKDPRLKQGGAKKGGPHRRVTAADRKNQEKLGLGGAGGAGRGGGGNAERRERARRRQKQRARKKGCVDRLLRRCLASNVEINLNRQSTKISGDAMLLMSEVKGLRMFYDKIDLDQAGVIDFDEFFEAVQEPRTPFTDIVFTLVDDPATKIVVLDYEVAAAEAAKHPDPMKLPERVKGNVSFDDFVQLCATYCCYTRDDMLMFCFQAFDKDHSGVIDEEEFIELCATVNNMNPTYPGNFMRAMTEFDKNDDGMIDFEEFQMLNRRYPSVLFPIFRLQDLLQKATLGEKVWLKIQARQNREKRAEKYKKMHNGQLPPLSFSEKLSRKLCCCFMKEPVPGTWVEQRERIYNVEKKGKKGRKGRKGKKGKGGGGGGSKKYH